MGGDGVTIEVVFFERRGVARCEGRLVRKKVHEARMEEVGHKKSKLLWDEVSRSDALGHRIVSVKWVDTNKGTERVGGSPSGGPHRPTALDCTAPLQSRVPRGLQGQRVGSDDGRPPPGVLLGGPHRTASATLRWLTHALVEPRLYRSDTVAIGHRMSAAGYPVRARVPVAFEWLASCVASSDPCPGRSPGEKVGEG